MLSPFMEDVPMHYLPAPIESPPYYIYGEIDKNKLNCLYFPCHVFAIDRYLKKRKKRDNFVLIDIYCHGCPSMNVWKRYLEYVNDKTHEKSYDHVSFRSKAYGWGSYYEIGRAHV